MNDEIPLGSACSGYGGLEMGIGLVIPNLVTRWVADYEPPKKGKPQKQSAAKVLAHRYPSAPNLGDITIVNWPSTTPVRVICAGTPCQDVSAAGARAGMRAGTRSGIWSSMVNAIEHHRPTLVVWENVRGSLSAEADGGNVEHEICVCGRSDRRGGLHPSGEVPDQLPGPSIGGDDGPGAAAADRDAQGTACSCPDCGGCVDARNCAVEPCPICMGDERECTLRALGRVLGDLAELGYDTVWYGLPAAAVGAPHERFRVFVAAWPANAPGIKGSGSNRERQSAGRADQGGRDPDADPADVGHERGGPARGWGDGPPDRGDPAADSDSIGREPVLDGIRPGQPDATRGRRNAPTAAEGLGWDEGRPEPAGQLRGSDAAERGSDASTDTDRCGWEPVGAGVRGGEPDTAGGRGTDWGPFAAAIARWEAVLGRPAPAPTGLTTRGGQALSPAFVEWMMGLPPGWVTDVPNLTRNEMLHVLGNGVVPQQAGAAVEYLVGFAPPWVRADLGLPPTA